MTHFGDKVVAFLKNTTTTLEDLQLQTALGKAELSDKLEEIKKETKQNIHQIKSDINSFVDDKKEDLNHLKGKIEQLEMQIALEKAETIDELNKQKKNLTDAFTAIKNIYAK